MAVRHVDVAFSLAPTKSQAQRFFALIFQNVTDFSGYTADPVIGSYLTGGSTVTVNAVGANMPVTVVNEFNPGTANAITVLQIGNLYHIIANSTSNNGCIFASSIEAGSYCYQSNVRTLTPVNATMHSSANSLVVLTGLNYRIRISESYVAVATNVVSGTLGNPGYTNNWRSYLFARHDDEIVFVNRRDAWTTVPLPDSSEMQIAEAMVLYPPSLLNTTKPMLCTLLTNLGPAATVYNGNALPVTGSTAGSRIPTFLKDIQTQLNKKPVFQFKVYDMNNGKIYDVSGIHDVLTLAYGKLDDYADTVSSGGTDYRAVGSFLFAS